MLYVSLEILIAGNMVSKTIKNEDRGLWLFNLPQLINFYQIRES